MAPISQGEINRRLNQNGWQWRRFYVVEPDAVIIELAHSRDSDVSKNIEGLTLAQAIDVAEAFVTSTAAIA